MFVDQYYTCHEENFYFPKHKSSAFAKQIAKDFNPLHDVKNRRFCVPGDLIFSAILSKFGANKEMTFDFKRMINGIEALNVVSSNESISVKNIQNEEMISIHRGGEITHDKVFINGFIRSYVEFSGKMFPEVILNAMKKSGVMPSLKRPLIIYVKMSFSLNVFSSNRPQVMLRETVFEKLGRKGVMSLYFDVWVNGEIIGFGEKKIFIGSVCPCDPSALQVYINSYNARNNICPLRAEY